MERTPQPAERQGLRRLQRVLHTSYLVVAVALIAVAAVMALGRQLLPWLPLAEAELNRWAAAQCGCEIEVRLGESTWRGFYPTLRLSSLHLKPASVDMEVHVQAAELTPDPWRSLLQWRLVMRRVAAERIEVQWRTHAKSPLDGSSEALAQVRDWLERNPRLSIAQAQLDQISGDQRLRTQVHGLRWHPKGDQVHLRGAVEPTGLASPAQLRATWPTGGSIDRFSAYLELPPQQVHPTRVWASAATQVQSLDLGARLWLSWQAEQPARVQGQVLADSWRLPAGSNPPRAADRLRLDFKGEARFGHTSLIPENWQLQVAPLRLLVPNAAPTETRLHLKGGAGQPVLLLADQIDIAPWTDWALALTALPALRQALLDTDPSGRLETVQIQWEDLSSDALRRPRVSAQIRGFANRAHGGAPSTQGIAGQLLARGAEGLVRLNAHAAQIHFPQLFPSAWQPREVSGDLFWRFTPDQIELGSGPLQVRAEGYRGAADFRLRVPTQGDAPHLGLRVGIGALALADGRQFLPRLPSAPALEAWLNTALHDGQLTSGALVYAGSLRFADGPQSARLLQHYDVDQANLVFEPGWPALDAGSAQVQLVDDALDLHLSHGDLAGLQLGQGTLRGRTTPSGAYQLELKVPAAGEVGQAKRFVLQTPLASTTGVVLNALEGSGTLKGQLTLNLRLVDPVVIGYALRLSVDADRVQVTPAQLEYTNVRGTVQLSSEGGVSSEAISGVLFGKPVRLSIESDPPTQAGAQTRIHQTGRIGAQDLLKWLDLPIAQVTGLADYRAELQLPSEASTPVLLHVTSDLVGVQSTLPAPADKPAQASWKTEAMVALPPKAPPRVTLQLGARARMQIEAATDHPPRIALCIQCRSVELPRAGFALQGTTASVSLPAWSRAFQTLNLPAKGATNFPVTARLSIEQLHLTPGWTATEVVAGYDQNASGWQLSIESPDVSGTVQGGESGRPVLADFQRLSIPMPSPGSDASQPRRVTPASMAKLPPTRVQINALEIDRQPLGRWTFELQPMTRGLGLNNIRGEFEGFRVNHAELLWRMPETSEEASTTRLRMRATGGDVARLTGAFGLEPVASSEALSAEADLIWPGDPTDLALAGLTGRVDINAENGKMYTGGNTGALGVLSLFNLDALIRRLDLNLTDLGGNSLNFRRLSARAALDQGTATLIEPLRIDSGIGKFSLTGSADLLTNTVDGHLVATLALADNLPWYAGLLGGVPTAVTVFIATRILERPLAQMTSARYRIQGNWNDPQVSLEEIFADENATPN